MKDYLKTQVLVVGAGISGLCFAISAKKLNKDLEICVVDKSLNAGNHILSGAIIDSKVIDKFIKDYIGNIDDFEELKKALNNKVDKEKMLFLMGKNFSIDIIKILTNCAKIYKPFGMMQHDRDYVGSLSRVVSALENIAIKMGIEVYHSFSVKEIIFDEENKICKGVKLQDTGLNQEGEKQINFKEGEEILADFIVLAEGADGQATEDFIKKAKLERKRHQMYSTCVKEIIEVSDEQYKAFGKSNVIHTLGYPICNFLTTDIFGGGFIYPQGENKIGIGIIVGLDWKFKDFSLQDALCRLKNHKAIKKYLENGKVVEAGAKMIPEGGFYAIPRGKDKEIGLGNTIILGDSAGFVDMRKIKGIHNAIKSGEAGAKALVSYLNETQHTDSFALKYTKNLKENGVIKEMFFSRDFRQTIAQYGNLIGMPMSMISHKIPVIKEIEEDYKAIRNFSYPLKLNEKFDKDFFVAQSKAEHRETSPNHIKIKDKNICKQCEEKYKSPCIAFCPAGVYEKNKDNETYPINFTNCLHCKTCQRKCPYQNIIWEVPEGGGGPRYKNS